MGKSGCRKGVLVGVPGGKFAKEDRSRCESQARKLDLIQETLRVLQELWFRMSNLIAVCPRGQRVANWRQESQLLIIIFSKRTTLLSL